MSSRCDGGGDDKGVEEGRGGSEGHDHLMTLHVHLLWPGQRQLSRLSVRRPFARFAERRRPARWLARRSYAGLSAPFVAFRQTPLEPSSERPRPPLRSAFEPSCSARTALHSIALATVPLYLAFSSSLSEAKRPLQSVPAFGGKPARSCSTLPPFDRRLKAPPYRPSTAHQAHKSTPR